MGLQSVESAQNRPGNPTRFKRAGSGRPRAALRRRRRSAPASRRGSAARRIRSAAHRGSLRRRRAGVAFERRRGLVRRGRASASRRRVRAYRGAPARRTASAVGPISTIRPRNITAVVSQMWATTPRSWLIRRKVTPASRCEVAHQVERLRLDRDVERRHRLVGDHQLRPRDQRAGDGDRAGAGRRRIRAGICRRPRPAGRPRGAIRRPARAARARDVPPSAASGSATIRPTRMRGSSEP